MARFKSTAQYKSIVTAYQHESCYNSCPLSRRNVLRHYDLKRNALLYNFNNLRDANAVINI